jgi:hypothetical protein
MRFTSWIPSNIYTVELDDYEIVGDDISFAEIVVIEVKASAVANAAIFKMMGGGHGC